MALFNRRKKNKDVLPQEVREYYQAERRERTGMAWLLALATLLVTFLVAAGLFFGGRWVYRAIFDNDNNTTSQTQKTDSEQTKTDSAGEQPTSNPSTPTGGSSPEAPATTGGQTSSTNTDTPSSGGSVGGTSTTGTTGSRPTSTPDTGPSELVNTGAGDIVGLFVIVTLASALAHRVVLAKRQ